MSIYNKEYKKLINAIFDYYGTDKESLSGSSRKAYLVEARHIFAYCLREKFHLSFPAIGKILKRDHTTIIYSYNKISLFIDKNQRIKKLLKQLLGSEKVQEHKQIVSLNKKRDSIDNKKVDKHLSPASKLTKQKGTDNYIKEFLPKFKKGVKKYELPIEFNEDYLSSIFDKLKERHKSIVLNRYHFLKKSFPTLQKLVPTYDISRQRLKQIIDSSFQRIYYNNYGAVRQILVLLSKEIIEKDIILINSFKKQIYLAKKENEAALLKFLFAIMSIVHWIKVFEFSGNKFFINVNEEDKVLEHIDSIKQLIKKIVDKIPDSIEDKWIYIYKNLMLDDYFQKYPNLLNEDFLRSCFDNYLFEKEIIVFRNENIKKYTLKLTKKEKKINGVPDEYKVFFK